MSFVSFPSILLSLKFDSICYEHGIVFQNFIRSYYIMNYIMPSGSRRSHTTSTTLLISSFFCSSSFSSISISLPPLSLPFSHVISAHRQRPASKSENTSDFGDQTDLWFGSLPCGKNSLKQVGNVSWNLALSPIDVYVLILYSGTTYSPLYIKNLQWLTFTWSLCVYAIDPHFSEDFLLTRENIYRIG